MRTSSMEKVMSNAKKKFNELLSTSLLCIALIKHMEGLRLKPYKDSGDKFTIGYGHLIKRDESFTQITPEEAESILNQDIKHAENAVKDLVQVPLSQNQFDAMTCFLFNISPEKFKGSATLRMLNLGNYDAVSDRLKLWNKVDKGGYLVPERGLTKRRMHETALWDGVLTDESQFDNLPEKYSWQ